MSKIKYAIQGGIGSFHHTALNRYLGKQLEDLEKDLICCASFGEVAQLVSQDKSVQGVMAIENSSVGSLLYNYNLIQQHKLFIWGEVYIPIQQSLLANPGVKISDISEVHSHPIALQQCLQFLQQYNWKRVETQDTAMSAANIQQQKYTQVACIASKLAASMYGLVVLADEINDFKKNHTRFLIVSQYPRPDEDNQNRNKASIQFRVSDGKGTLAPVLQAISACDVYMSKLQSFAVPGTHFDYYFIADLYFPELHYFEQVVQKIKPLTQGLTIYGTYPKGN